MLKLEYSSQFKKDFKKIAKLPIPDIVEAGHVIKQLQLGEVLPAKYIHLLDFDLFDSDDAQKEQAVWRFEMRDSTQPDVLLGNELQLNIIELKKADRLGISAETLNAWITFFEHWQEDALMASITHEPIKKAMNRIKLLSASEEEKRLALVRERALHDEATLMYESREEGREEGLEEAREEARKKTSIAVMNLVKLGLPDEQIAEAFQIEMEELQTIKDEYLH